jgi:tetratricopeptide (TPR) repeat protein
MNELGTQERSFHLGLTAFPRLSEAQRDFEEGKYDAAAGRVIQHLREHRDEPRGLAMLGAIAVRTGALVQGERFLRKAMALGFINQDIRHELASVLHKQHRIGEALEAYGELEQETSDVQFTAMRALLLSQLGMTAESLEVYRQLLDREAGKPGYWIAYGHALRAAGETEEAVAAYRRVTELDPEFGEAWWSIANIKSRILTDDDVLAMESALKFAVDLLNVGPLHFALGRALHDRQDYEGAFAHYREGNRLEGETVRYDPKALSDEVDEFIRTARPDGGQRRRIHGGDDPVPIFVISMPRSGTTLLEQILDQHPDIEAVGELPYVRGILRSALEIETRRRPIEVPEFLLQLSAEQKQELGAEYMRRAALHRRTDARYFVDKMPTNWSDVMFIREILPQAHVIEIRRNAMDCCFSNFIHQFSKSHAAAFDLHNIGRCYVDYARLMDHMNSIAPSFMQSLSYEALVDEPEAALRPMLAELGLEWDDALLRFYESRRSVRTPSAEQVRRPLNREGIGSWKPYAEWLGPLREALGPLADA